MAECLETEIWDHSAHIEYDATFLLPKQTKSVSRLQFLMAFWFIR